jgi:hypothetical protein
MNFNIFLLLFLKGLRLLAIGLALVILLHYSDPARGAEPPARPHDRPVRIFSECYGGEKCVDKTGETVLAPHIYQILFVNEPCPMAPRDRDMHRAWFFGAGVGCWAALSDGTYAIALASGEFNPQGALLETLPRAMLHPDNSALITEPEYNSRTAQSLAVLRLQERFIAAMHAKP